MRNLFVILFCGLFFLTGCGECACGKKNKKQEKKEEQKQEDGVMEFQNNGEFPSLPPGSF
jgi:outer membrane biogenesis lipoprotein LolB